MRIRWDEVDEGGGSSHFLGFTALTWGIAAPVAFIAGAAVMSYFDQSRHEPMPQVAAAPAVSGNATPNGANDSRLEADRSKWEQEAKKAAAKAAQLQSQVETLRGQMSSETRRREEAEQVAAQKSSELDRMQQAEPVSEAAAPSTTLALADPGPVVNTTVSNAVSPPALATPVVATPAVSATETQADLSEIAKMAAAPAQGEISDDSVVLQQIIEDTASRSAATSDKDGIEVGATSMASAARTARAPRSDSTVERAMGRATGLENLSAAEQIGLKAALVSGECVTVSLEKVFGSPIPVVPLRNLVRDLDSEC